MVRIRGQTTVQAIPVGQQRADHKGVAIWADGRGSLALTPDGDPTNVTASMIPLYGLLLEKQKKVCSGLGFFF